MFDAPWNDNPWVVMLIYHNWIMGSPFTVIRFIFVDYGAALALAGSDDQEARITLERVLSSSHTDLAADTKLLVRNRVYLARVLRRLNEIGKAAEQWVKPSIKLDAWLTPRLFMPQ